MCGVLIWVEFKILSSFLILPHKITISVNLLLNSPAKSSLRFMNLLLESIITYRLPLPLSKISVSLGFGDIFRYAGAGLDFGGELSISILSASFRICLNLNNGLE